MKQLVNAIDQILYKLQTNDTIQAKFEGLLNLTESSFVKRLIGNEENAVQIKSFLEAIRSNQMLRDVVSTIKNILDCYSTDRFVGAKSEEQLRHDAFNLNRKRLFQAAIFFNETNIDTRAVSYRLHMDVFNSQPTIENRNRFWFPGPAGNMLIDLKYHRGFVQIKQAIDLAIIKYHKKHLNDLGLLPVSSLLFKNSESNFQVNYINDDEDDDDDFFNDSEEEEEEEDITISSNTAKNDFSLNPDNNDTLLLDNINNQKIPYSEKEEDIIKSRFKRQNLNQIDVSFIADKNDLKFDIDEMHFFTKQFPYPSYTRDE